MQKMIMRHLIVWVMVLKYHTLEMCSWTSLFPRIHYFQHLLKARRFHQSIGSKSHFILAIRLTTAYVRACLLILFWSLRSVFSTRHLEALLSCQNECRLKLHPVQFLRSTQVAIFVFQICKSNFLVWVSVKFNRRLVKLHHTAITIEQNYSYRHRVLLRMIAHLDWIDLLVILNTTL
jgi:hypothetical protein